MSPFSQLTHRFFAFQSRFQPFNSPWTGSLFIGALFFSAFIGYRRGRPEPLFPKPSDPESEYTPSEKYTYAPIDSAGHEIRLIRLHPARNPARNPSAPIQCSIIHARLDSQPNFVALSYVWGSPTRTAWIHVDGRGVRVTLNLHRFLAVLRSKLGGGGGGGGSVGDTFWADAVCIDQADADEKAAQIPLMARIFGSARTVVGYLGPATSRTWRALGLVRELAHLARHDAEGLTGRRLRWVRRRTSPGLATCAWMDVVEVFCREWFSRAWILQEIVLSRDLLLFCGEAQCSLDDLVMAAVCTRLLGDMVHFAAASPFMRPRDDAGIARVRGRFLMLLTGVGVMLGIGNAIKSHKEGESPHEFYTIMKLFFGYGATDVRDKLYGLRSLAGPEHKEVLDLPVDYSVSATELFCGFFRNHLTMRKNLGFLLDCSPDRRLPGLPSWIPSGSQLEKGFDSPSEIGRFPRPSALSDSVPQYAFGPAPEQLFLRGRILDHVTLVGDAQKGFDAEPGVSFEPQARIIRTWARLVDPSIPPLPPEGVQDYFPYFNTATHLQRPYVSGGTAAEAFTRLILYHHSGPLEGLEYEPLPQFLQQEYRADRWSDEEKRLKNLDGRARRAVGGRRFFITERGCFGLGHAETSVGDEVCIFAGPGVPFTVRGNERGWRELIGECYVQGVMGEVDVRSGGRVLEMIELR